MNKVEKVNIILKKENIIEYDKKIHDREDIIDFIIKKEDLNLKAETECYVIVLNIKNQIIGYSLIAKGGLEYANIDMKNIFKRVLLLNGCKIIILKNNPSGVNEFSNADREFKKHLENACEIMQIKLLDFITTEKKYTSLM